MSRNASGIQHKEGRKFGGGRRLEEKLGGSEVTGLIATKPLQTAGLFHYLDMDALAGQCYSSDTDGGLSFACQPVADLRSMLSTRR